MPGKRFQFDGPFCVAASLTFHAGIALAMGWVSLQMPAKQTTHETPPTVTLTLRIDRADTAETLRGEGGTNGGEQSDANEALAMGAGAPEVEQPVRPTSPAKAEAAAPAPPPAQAMTEPPRAASAQPPVESAPIAANPPFSDANAVESPAAPVAAFASLTTPAPAIHASEKPGLSTAHATGGSQSIGQTSGDGGGTGTGDQAGRASGVGGGASSGGMGVGNRSGGDAEAAALSVVKPAYPTIARQRGQTGVVVLAIEVRADGTIGDVAIAESSGFSKLDQAALEAARRSRFAPAQKSGVAVTSIIRWRFRFSLETASR